jgi:hypothetical protein
MSGSTDVGEMALSSHAPIGSATMGLANFHVFALTALLFVAPNALFATALRPVPAAIVLMGCAGALAFARREAISSRYLAAAVDARALPLCLAGGLTLCLLGGEGHFFYSPWDWLTRDAVLADLVRDGTKALYRYEGQEYMLRAPLGMYLVPAAVGRFFGLYAAHLALLTQNSFIVGAILYFSAALAEVRKIPFLALLIAFSGLDIIGTLVAEAIAMAQGGAFEPFSHIEWWSGRFTRLPLQYSSFVTQLFWVPNHMAPGWWFALLALLHARGEIAFSTLLASCAPLLLWSPLAMMGGAPFVLYFASRIRGRQLFATDMLLATAAVLCFVPVALYLVMDAGAVPKEWLIFRDGFAWIYPAFILIEIPQAAIVLYTWRKVAVPDRGPLLVALALLLAIPIYRLGLANDFVMRASIAPLFLLAFSFARIAVLTPRDDSAFPTLIAVVVLISAVTPTLEMKGVIQGRYAVSDCNLLTAWSKTEQKSLPTNYLARREQIPSWLLSPEGAAAPLEVEKRLCWPDHPSLSDRDK